MYEFKLDFTVSVPYRYCPTLQEAKVNYIQQIAQAPMDIEFRDLRTGIFLITVDTEADKKRLMGKSLSYDFGEKPHTLHTAKVPFILQEKRAFYANPKWVTIDKLYDSGLQYVSHEQVDVFLARYGTIIVPTKYKTDVHGFRTGKRDARIDLKVDIDRWQSVAMKVEVDGKEVDVTGKVNFFYKGQPYNCRDCQEVHSEKCPQKVTREVAEAEGEKFRTIATKTLMVGDSNMRRINEKAFYAKTDCATGAKIGHVANSLEWTAASEHENVIIHAGQNNVSIDPKVEINTWEKKMKDEVTKLENQVKNFKNVLLVGVPPAPWCRKTDKTKLMRKKVNKALQGMTSNPKIKFLEIEQSTDDDDDANWEDDRHMTERFTNFVMSKICVEMYELQEGPFFIKNVPWTCKGKYSGLNSTYRLGCDECTGMGHSSEKCSRKGKSNKRGPPSGGESPETKRGAAV